MKFNWSMGGASRKREAPSTAPAEKVHRIFGAPQS